MQAAENFKYPENFLKYIGTGGGRFSMIKQIRSTGGIWFDYGGLRGVIDPGPGSLARICAAVPALDMTSADVVILTHKHIDHSTDINVAIEAMTHGGFDRRGTLVAPEDALQGPDPVVMKHSQNKIPEIKIPEDGVTIETGKGVCIEPVKHIHHGVDCFGYVFRREGLKEWGIISDSRIMPCFCERYASCAFLSVNATFLDKKPRLDHISVTEARELISKIGPQTAVLTHLGAMLTAPEQAGCLDNLETPQTKILPASDGMVVDLDTLGIYAECFAAPAAGYERLL